MSAPEEPCRDSDLELKAGRDATKGPGDTEARVEREREFHDAAFTTDVRAPTWRFYEAVAHLFENYAQSVLADAGGRDVLELGCGRGGQAFDLAARGDRVLAIDISQAAVDITRSEAELRSVNLNARVMDAHKLDIADDSVDLVCGSGILHHLELTRALSEACRVLTPGGRALFLEPLGHNPAINAYRGRTPLLRSADERPLRRSDLQVIRTHFTSVETSFGGLVTLPLVLLGQTREGSLMRAASSLERRLMRYAFPGIASWFVLLDCHHPAAARAAPSAEPV